MLDESLWIWYYIVYTSRRYIFGYLPKHSSLIICVTLVNFIFMKLECRIFIGGIRF